MSSEFDKNTDATGWKTDLKQLKSKNSREFFEYDR